MSGEDKTRAPQGSVSALKQDSLAELSPPTLTTSLHLPDALRFLSARSIGMSNQLK